MGAQVKYPRRNADIVALRRQGIEPTDIASRLDLTRNTVLGVLYRSGLTDKRSDRARNAAYTPEHRRRVLASVKASGLSAAARLWGVSQNTICCWQRGL